MAAVIAGASLLFDIVETGWNRGDPSGLSVPVGDDVSSEAERIIAPISETLAESSLLGPEPVSPETRERSQTTEAVDDAVQGRDIDVRAAHEVVVPPSRAPVEGPIRAAERRLVALRNGEQESFAEGRAAVAVEFSRIGEIELATLRITTSTGTRNEALLTAGGIFEIAEGEQLYRVSVQKLDHEHGLVVLWLDLPAP